MKPFEGILLCTDLDGTLLKNDKRISEENLQAIRHFQNGGGAFTFITGRMPYFVSDICKTVEPNVPFGCINGGGIYDYENNRYVWTRELEHSVLELVQYADEHLPNLGIQVNTFDKIYFCRENDAMVHFRSLTGVANLQAEIHEIREPIAKIVFGDLDENKILHLQNLLNEHPRANEFDFIRSEYMLYEILPKGISKGNVLLKMAELLHMDSKRTIGVGDYNNDISLLRAAGVGIAVSNATPEAKAAADRITVSNEEHAIARIIYDIENGDIPV